MLEKELGIFNDGLTITDTNNSNKKVIQEGFTDVNPFLKEEERKKKVRDTNINLLLEDVKNKKSNEKINYNNFINKRKK